MPSESTLSTAAAIVRSLKRLSDPSIAAHSQRFFKTGPGEYGEGDQFLGIRVPNIRLLSKKCAALSLAEMERLLHSPYHEARLLAVILLAHRFKKANDTDRHAVYTLYLANTPYLNNWDIVDSSAHLIVGPWLENRPRDPLFQLARSPSLWERRIAIMATYHFIRQNQLDTTLALAEQLIGDSEDLIHKAVGWMLRELGKRDRAAEECFLRTHHHQMPRTMLRYAIEKFPEALRKRYLKGTV